MYTEINPSLELKKSVDTFWVFSNNKFKERFKVCPDTYTDLIFDLNQNIGYLSAAMTNHQQREVQVNSNLVGIRFKSENFGSLLGIPLDEVKNLRIELSELLPRFDFSIMSELKSSVTIKKKVNKLKDYIARFLNQNLKG